MRISIKVTVFITLCLVAISACSCGALLDWANSQAVPEGYQQQYTYSSPLEK